MDLRYSSFVLHHLYYLLHGIILHFWLLFFGGRYNLLEFPPFFYNLNDKEEYDSLFLSLFSIFIQLLIQFYMIDLPVPQ